MSTALMLRMQWSVSSTLPLLLRLENTSTSSLTVESPLSSLYVLTSLLSLPLLLAETREMCVCVGRFLCLIYAPCFSSLSHTLSFSLSETHTHTLSLPQTVNTLSHPPPQEGGRIECENSHLEEVESLECDSARRRRHAVSPSVKQRWRRARETSTAAGLIRRTRATSSLVSILHSFTHHTLGLGTLC